MSLFRDYKYSSHEMMQKQITKEVSETKDYIELMHLLYGYVKGYFQLPVSKDVRLKERKKKGA